MVNVNEEPIPLGLRDCSSADGVESRQDEGASYAPLPWRRGSVRDSDSEAGEMRCMHAIYKMHVIPYHH